MRLTFQVLAIVAFLSLPAQAGEDPIHKADRIGYELSFTDGKKLQVITRGRGVASVWIGEDRFDIVTFDAGDSLGVHVTSKTVSRAASVGLEGPAPKAPGYGTVELSFPRVLRGLARFDARDADLGRGPGGADTFVSSDGVGRTCGTCGSWNVWVTNACTFCNGGWLCDKIKAPW